MNKKPLPYIKILIGVMILFLLIYKIGIDSIFSTLKQIKIHYIAIVIGLYLLNLLIGTLNVNILIKPYKHKINILKLFRYYVLSFSLGLFFPGRIGDMSLIYFLKKEKIDLGPGSSVFVLDKLITINILILLSIMGFSMFFTRLETLKLTLTILFILIIGLFMVFSEKGRYLIKRYILRGYSKRFKGFSKSLYNYLKNYKKEVALNYIITVFKTMLDSTIIYVLLLSFDISVPFLWVVIIKAIMVTISLIPITLNGIGIKESAGVLLFMRLNVDATIITAILIFILILNYIIAAFILTSLLKKDDLNFKKILKT